MTGRTARALLAAVVPVLPAVSGCVRATTPPAPAPAFGEPVKINDLDGGYAQAEPVISAGDGNLVVAWTDWTPPRPSVRMATSSNGGRTFSRSVPVQEPDASHDEGQADPTVARTSDGRTVLAWMACRAGSPGAGCDILERESLDGGRAWSQPEAIAEGGEVRRDRPWLSADGARLVASWLELLPAGVRWAVAAEGTSGWLAPVASLDGRSGVIPIAAAEGRLEALVQDTGRRTPGRIVLERIRSTDGGRAWETLGDLTFDSAAVLLEFSIGALAVGPRGESWIAMPRGTGDRNDFVLAWRGPGLDAYRTAGTLRAGPRGRVGLPRLLPLDDGRFLAAWLEEDGEGWSVRARTLGPGPTRSAAANVSRIPFAFQTASLTRNIGEVISAAHSDGRAWIAWSDTRDGDADVMTASMALEK